MSNYDNDLISVKETAEILGYSRIHIVRLINSGAIKATRIGRSYAVDKNSLGGIFKKITPVEEKAIDKAMKRVVKDFSPVLKKLGKE
jgi:excisionase family DNA binding protein